MAVKYLKTQPLVAKHAEIAIKIITWMPWNLLKRTKNTTFILKATQFNIVHQ